MREILTQHEVFAWAIAGTAAALLIIVVLVFRHRSRGRATAAEAVLPSQAEPTPRLDATALMVALQDAKTCGHKEKLPELYLSLAQCRIEAGQMGEAEELLRHSIRGATGGQHKEVHARARLALGDLAHTSGDPTTACEHWQIARTLFYELNQPRNHKAAESRMLRNGCPTDWVLTDF